MGSAADAGEEGLRGKCRQGGEGGGGKQYCRFGGFFDRSFIHLCNLRRSTLEGVRSTAGLEQSLCPTVEVVGRKYGQLGTRNEYLSEAACFWCFEPSRTWLIVQGRCTGLQTWLRLTSCDTLLRWAVYSMRCSERMRFGNSDTAADVREQRRL